MKKIRYSYLLTLAVLLAGLLVSCQRDRLEEENGGSGTLTLALLENLNPVEVIRGTKSDGRIYKVEIFDESGDLKYSCEDFTEMPETVSLKSGNYTVSASSGTDAQVGNDPYYAGEAPVVIKANQASSATVTCYLANSKVSAVYTDEVKDYFPTRQVTITSEDQSIVLLDDNTGGYFRSGNNLSVVIRLVNTNGTVYEIPHTIVNTKPREHYILNIKVSESGGGDDEGGVIPGLDVDETMDEEEIDIIINIDQLPRPDIDGDGFNIVTPLQVTQGKQKDAKVLVSAQAGIHSIGIAHTDDHLQQMGIPRSLDLTHADAETVLAMQALGITWSSDPFDGAEEAFIDFTGLTALLDGGNYAIDITVIDKQNLSTEKTLKIEVTDWIEVVTLATDPWGKFALVAGQWETDEKPAGLGFEYKKATESIWQSVPESQLEFEGKMFTARIGGLDPLTDYEVRSVTGESKAKAIQFTTESAAQLSNFGFNDWYKDGKNWYASTEEQFQNSTYIWDSGNKGANTSSEVNPTRPEYDHKVAGEASVRLGSTTAVLGVFAAASIYTGQFYKTNINWTNPLNSGAELDFGIPYSSRPLRMTGYYDYHPGTIDKSKSPYKDMEGESDTCHIWVMLTDWENSFRINTVSQTFISLDDPGIIAYGELTDGKESGGFKSFTIDLEYRTTERKPTHIIVVASASKYGDYFTGSTKSVLYVDEFEFEFE